MIMLWRILSLAFVGLMSLVCMAFFWIRTEMLLRQPDYHNNDLMAVMSPHPHHVPERPGGLSLRFVMVHDVIHQRYPQHGDAYYEERIRLQEQATQDKHDSDDAARWPLVDDYCVGLDKLHRSAEAVPVMREKLEQQIAQGLTGKDLYTSYANLGTFLIHANFAAARLGDADAYAAFQEGLTLIEKAVEVNPGAHFGRERWQLAIAQFLLRSFEDPELLKKFDCIGNRLTLSQTKLMDSDYLWATSYGRPSRALFTSSAQHACPEFFPPSSDPAAEENWETFQVVRDYITRVGAGDGNLVNSKEWQDLNITSHQEVAPFDEPTLGIIGMWREGGGANPHFALALGEIMVRVGQRFIAWTAYERASELAERYHPDPEIQEFLRNHCRQRQLQLDLPNESELRSQYAAELAFGQEYQRAYQHYEAEQIAQGVPLDSPGFYDAFYAAQQVTSEAKSSAIATPPGKEELMRYVPVERKRAHRKQVLRNWSQFGAGLGAMLAALPIYFYRRSSHFKKSPASGAA